MNDSSQKQDSDLKDRVRVVFVSPRMIVDIMNWANAPIGSVLRFDAASDIPQDAEVVRVFDLPMRRELGFVIQHPSFDPVLLGREMPIHTSDGRLVHRIIRKSEKVSP